MVSKSKLIYLHESVREKLIVTILEELILSAQTLREHLGSHIDPCVMYEFGPPAYDIQVLRFRGFSPRSFVRGVYQLLERKDSDLMECRHHEQFRKMFYKGPAFREDLSDTLLVIEDIFPGEIKLGKIAEFERRALSFKVPHPRDPDIFLSREGITHYGGGRYIGYDV